GFAALSAHHCYHGMEYSDDKKQIAEWIPLVMEGRDPSEHVAATRMVTGTDVDYGALTKDLLDSLKGKEGFSIHFFYRVMDLRRDGKLWNVRIRNEKTGERGVGRNKFVFIGGGGGLLPSSKKAGVPGGGGARGFRGGGGVFSWRVFCFSSPPQRQGIWQSGGRLTADVRTASGHASH